MGYPYTWDDIPHGLLGWCLVRNIKFHLVHYGGITAALRCLISLACQLFVNKLSKLTTDTDKPSIFFLFIYFILFYHQITGQWPVNSLHTLQWRHNGRDSVSNHQPYNYLLNGLFKRRSKKTSKLRVTGLCAGNSPETGEFSAQMASNAENVSIWWRHHEGRVMCLMCWYHDISWFHVFLG